MSKHTPGPWKISMAAPYHHYQVSSVSGERVCGTFDALESDAPAERRRENAKLIAAAPELLEALKECAARIEIHMVHTEDLIAHMKAVSAIAKATGESE